MLGRRVELDVGLAHAHAYFGDGEALDDRVGDGRGEGLEQQELTPVRDLAHAGGDLAVVDRVLEAVGRRRDARLQREVEEETLAFSALSLVDTVMAVEFEALQLDCQAQLATAWAAARASACSRTSCTRRMVAPRS